MTPQDKFRAYMKRLTEKVRADMIGDVYAAVHTHEQGVIDDEINYDMADKLPDMIQKDNEGWDYLKH